MFRKKNYNGITKKTVENLQLGAGAFFKNYNPKTDTYATAKEAGKLIGATEGGGKFTAKATIRQIAVDGAGSRAKGLIDVDGWEVSLSTTIKEITADTLKIALGCAEAVTSGEDIPTGYTKVSGKMGADESDFIENVTWIGCVTGSDKPLIISVYNAFNEDGLSVQTQDGGEGSVACTFYGYIDLDDYMSDEVKPPFDIYYPTVTATPTTPETEGEPTA